MKIALTELRLINEDCLYLYPVDLYDIEGIKSYDDLKTLRQYTEKCLKPYREQKADIYINAGVLTEKLMAIQVADEYNMDVSVWHRNNMDGIYSPQQLRKKEERSLTISGETVERCLCKGRHGDITVPAIFQQIPEERILDFEWMQQRADEELKMIRGKHLKLYATGLTQLLVSVWNAARKYGIGLEVLHYNADTEQYFSQKLN